MFINIQRYASLAGLLVTLRHLYFYRQYLQMLSYRLYTVY